MFLWILKLYIFLYCLIIVSCVHRSLEEARTARLNLVKKHFKKLKKTEGALQLVGGRNDYEGNVEILHNGKWGAICDDEWDKTEAQVVCKQLGFTGSSKFTHSSQFGQARKKFWMDNLLCSGLEDELVNCRFDGWGKNDCEASEAAGVICDDSIAKKLQPQRVKKNKYKIGKKSKIEIRLNGGRVDTEGKVEVRFNKGEWGSICPDGWSLLEANVVCKSLGFGYASEALQTDYFSSSGHLKIMLSGTECYGNETSLNECIHHNLNDLDCPGTNNYVASVSCVSSMADLVIDYLEIEQSAHLEDKPIYFLQCAMEENCLASRAYDIQRENVNWHLETRRLLKFTAKVLNAGTADFRPLIPKHLWEWHMCHMHYHSMEVFAVFNIFNSEGEKVAEGHKASFCLEDNQCLPGVEPKYACANYGDQGISVNCADIYRYNIDCQWIDISELEPGTYKMKVAVNPEFKVPEISFDNNAATCTLLYTESYARVFDCHIERP